LLTIVFVDQNYFCVLYDVNLVVYTHHLNTIDYLNHIIQNLPNAKMSEVASFLPQNCLQFQAKSNTEIESQEKILNI